MATLTPVLQNQLDQTFQYDGDQYVNFSQYREVLRFLRGLSTGGGGGQVNSVQQGAGIVIDSSDPVNPVVIISTSGNSGLLTSFGPGNDQLGINADGVNLSIQSNVLTFTGNSGSINDTSTISTGTISQTLDFLASEIAGLDLQEVLDNGNVAVNVSIALTDGATTTGQLSAGQFIVGSPTGTSSMDSTGLIYSADGSTLRAEFMYNHISMSISASLRTNITTGSAFFGDGGTNVILLDAAAPEFYLTDGSKKIRFTQATIDDTGMGGGIDFSGTTGTIQFPQNGFKIGAGVTLANAGDSLYVSLGAGQALVLLDGAGGGDIRTGQGTMAGVASWKLGDISNNPSVLDAGKYIEVELNGTLWKLCLAQ